MVHHHHHHHNHETHNQGCESDNRPYKEKPFVPCCCYPCLLFSSLFRRLGRCAFVACYPILQCFRWDDSRHHHHPRHFH